MSAGSGAVIRVAIAPLQAEPRASSPQLSQRLAGHPVEIVAEEGDWLRVRGADGYEGWMHAGYLTRDPGGATRRSRGVSRLSLGCVTRTPAGGGRRALPLGAYLAPDEIVEQGEAIAVSDVAARFPRDAAAVERTAREFFDGTSYQWGGVTPWGADCSGFAQTVLALHGVALPRDAWQQAGAGDASAHGFTALESGELAFFSDRDDRAVTHVGLGIGGGRMAHVAIGRGGFAIERLGDGRDAYVAGLRERFLFARRIL